MSYIFCHKTDGSLSKHCFVLGGTVHSYASMHVERCLRCLLLIAACFYSYSVSVELKMCIVVDNMEANQSTNHKGSIPRDQSEMEFIESILTSRRLNMLERTLTSW